MSEKQNTINESISALMDNELSEHELHRLLKEIENNEEARQTWARYQAVSASFRNEYPANPEWDIAGRVRQALVSESISDDSRGQGLDESLGNSEVRQPSKYGNSSNLARFAVAASVTLAVIFGIQHYSVTQDAVGTQQLMADSAFTQNANQSQTQNTQPQNAQLQNTQLQNHAVGFRSPPIQTATVSDGNSTKVLSRPNEFSPIVLQNNVSKNLNSIEMQRRLNEYMLRHAEHAALNNGRGMMPFARVIYLEDK